MNRKLVIICCAVAIILVALAGWSLYQQLYFGTVVVNVVPTDATITIDNGSQVHPGTLHLSFGTHILTISREGFASQTVTVNVVKGKTSQQQIALNAITAEGLQYYTDHPDQKAIAEGIAGKKADSAAQSVSSQPQNGILALLPYFQRDWRIDYGPSTTQPNNPNAIALTITVNSQQGEQEALSWITSQGYNPADYQIIYKMVGQ